MVLARYACSPSESKGRSEKELHYDFDFLNDRNRVLFSSSFRRLEYKTQVFVDQVGLHYRTRLTHSLEVGSVAKFLARSLQVDEDLSETIALAHDLGHPPFGHAGEEGLNDTAKDFGGFDHNFHTLKIIGDLEKVHPYKNGMNLSYEVIEGIAKHNGPIRANHFIKDKIIKLFPYFDLKLDLYPTLEGQIASISDDIVYCAHDVEDGLRAGFITFEEIQHLEIIKMALATEQNCRHNSKLLTRTIREILISNTLKATRQLINGLSLKTADEVRGLKRCALTLDDNMSAYKAQLKDFLMTNVYRHPITNRMRYKSQSIVSKLFTYFLQHPECLPKAWYHKIEKSDNHLNHIAVIVIDYIAGMTDRFALDEFKKIFDASAF